MITEIKEFRGDVHLDLYNDTENFNRDGYADHIIRAYREALEAKGYFIVGEIHRTWKDIDPGFRSLVAEFETTSG